MALEVLQIMGDQLTRGIGCRAWTTTNSPLGLFSSPLPPLEASPLCSKVALADSVEDPLEAPPLCSKVALVDSVENPLEAHLFAARRLRSPNRGLYVAYFKRKTFFSFEISNVQPDIQPINEVL